MLLTMSPVECSICLTIAIVNCIYQDIGLPFYGRSFGTATGLNQPHSGADQVAWGIDDGEQQLCNHCLNTTDIIS